MASPGHWAFQAAVNRENHQRKLAELVHTQMQDHYWERATDYETHVSKGFITLRPDNYAPASGERRRDFRVQVPDPQRIKSMTFAGFRRCLYPEQKFDSESERRFAVLLEDEDADLKWFKPAAGVFQIHYSDDQTYEPDFVSRAQLDTAIEKLLSKGKDPAVKEVKLEQLAEGRCVQVLHTGPYSDEEKTIAAMDEFAAAQGLTRHGRHHELYISDPRRVAPERLRTILRHPVK